MPSIGKVATQFPGVDRTTLWCHLKHSQDSKPISAAKRGLLTPTESQELVDFIKEMGDQGFPLMYKKITEYGLAIVQIHNENIKCIGHNWAQRFVQRFEDQIGAKTCTLLEKTHASALNPENVRHHFDLLSKTIQSYGIHPRNIYNCDETRMSHFDKKWWYWQLPDRATTLPGTQQAVQSHEFSGDTVTKENFLEIYGTAHLKAFTKENILKAFQKSGIWPLNQDVVTPEMMWPSTMTSLDASSAVPVMLP
ncbi:uncharacterized protein EI90DRAFT_3128254 [Cantharellus anzutake]|uniref:uncharacterized protein n=1 Tax=Cantharellus anzutake TaxID=1750568 RepID=UPI00190590E3|nr:uncharacterized protein EI90DRAFT_3128254 [Cantharellus anzutake]KAF8326112.1 hypothetical protein EI90DRAFT_3128254 [Cantharellus anzutake]